MRTVPFRRTPLIGRRTLIWCLACCVNVLLAPAAAAQGGRLEIEYTVKVADIPGQLFHVTTDIRNINQPALDLSLPVWSPGWYVIENYAKNILRFRVTEPGGRQLRPALVRKRTWRNDTRGISRITVEFDYRAVVLAANQAAARRERDGFQARSCESRDSRTRSCIAYGAMTSTSSR